MLLNLDFPDGARLLWRAQERSFHLGHSPRALPGGDEGDGGVADAVCGNASCAGVTYTGVTCLVSTRGEGKPGEHKRTCPVFLPDVEFDGRGVNFTMPACRYSG